MTGELRHRIKIQRATRNKSSDSGQVELSWSTHATIWARIDTLSANELQEAAQTTERIYSKATIRHSSEVTDVTTADRVSFDARIFNIDGIVQRGNRNRFFLELTLTEVA